MYSRFLLMKHEELMNTFNNQNLFRSTFKFSTNFIPGNRLNYKAEDVSRDGTKIVSYVEMFTTTETDLRINVSAVYLGSDQLLVTPYFEFYPVSTGTGQRYYDKNDNLCSRSCCYLSNGKLYDVTLVALHNIFAKFDAFSLLEAANNSSRKGKVSINIVETPGNKTLFSPEIKLLATTEDFINELRSGSENQNLLESNSSNKALRR